MIDAKILVIIPAYNEQASIARVIERVKESVPAADIVVINDGSHDSTSLLAYESGAKVISLPYNLGIGAAVQTGFILAQSGNYEIAVQVDGDGQHDPSEIEVLMSRLLADEGAEVERGAKLAEWDPHTRPIITEKSGKIVFTDLAEAVSMREVVDEATGIASKVVIDWKSQSSKGDDLRPRLVIGDARGRALKLSTGQDAQYELPVEAIIGVENFFTT